MPELRLVSYNIHKGILKKSILRNLQNFADQGVTMFCLQEVRRPHEGQEFMGDVILEMLGPAWQGQFFLSGRPNNPDCGLGFIWNSENIKPIKFEELFLPKLGKLAIHQKLYAYFFVKDKIYPIQRASLIGTFQIGQRKVRISNVHLDHQGGFKHRFSQLVHLITNLKAEPLQDSEIICGDFNTLGLFSNANQIRQIQALLGEEYINSYPEFRITTAHYQHLDHVFTRNIKAIESKVYQWPGSDHYPVMVLLDLKSN